MDELFEMLSSLLGFAVSIGVVVTAVNSAKKKQQKKQAQQTLRKIKMEPTAASMKVMGMPDKTPPRAKTAQPVAEPKRRVAEIPAVQLQPKVQPRIQDAPPPQVQPEGSLNYVSHEGEELHEDGFHGQNHIAKTGPAGVIFAENGPRISAEQMRNAFIMKEILDAPVSRRGARGRRYGR